MTTSEGAPGPLNKTVRRWHEYLIRECIEYRGLQQERECGWHSAALDRWYGSRQTPQGKSDDDAPSTTGKSTSHDDETRHTAPVVSAFKDVDIARLCERYRDHIARVTGAASPSVAALFAPSVDPRTAPRTFVDLGCAPGGVSKYLCRDLKWRGVGLTLDDDKGGIGMDADMLAQHTTTELTLTRELMTRRAAARVEGGAFLLLLGDVSAPAASWSVYQAGPPRAQNTKSASPTASDMALLTAAEALQAISSSSVKGSPRFHFINGGAVQDHGQRQSTASPAATDAPGHKRPRNDDDEADEAGEEDEMDANVILPWFTLFVPQLLFALNHIEEGGSMMLVYGVPQCASCCIWLRALQNFLQPNVENESANASEETGEHTSSHSQSQDRVHVLGTIHRIKSPVYLLWQRLCSASQREEALARLVAAADPTSATLCPLLPSALRTEAQRQRVAEEENTLASLSAEARVRSKRQFWLGETELGFSLAQEGFETYGAALARPWENCRKHLAARRARAEAAMTAAPTTTAMSTAMSVPPSASKPPRRGRGTFHA